jgi:putative copper export protein
VQLLGVLLLGGAATCTWVAPARAVRRTLAMAGGLLLLGLALQLVGQLRAFDAFLADADPLGETLAIIARTGWGRNRLALSALAVTALAAAFAARTRATADWSTRLLAVAVLTLLPRLGHAAAVEEGVLRAHLLAMVHAGAAAIWLGALALLARAWWLDVPALVRALPAYGRLALVAAPLTMASGGLTAWPRLLSLSALVEPGWGQLLLAKAAGAILILALGALHHRRLVRAGGAPPRGTLLAELLLAVAVVALTGWLAESAPPG